MTKKHTHSQLIFLAFIRLAKDYRKLQEFKTTLKSGNIAVTESEYRIFHYVKQNFIGPNFGTLKIQIIFKGHLQFMDSSK